MSTLNTTINITRDAGTINEVNLTNLREAIQTTLEDNFYKILSRNKIETISSLTGDTDKSIVISISKDDNIITITSNNNQEPPLATIKYVPYISYVKYAQYTTFVDDSNSGATNIENKYRPVATVLLNILIDGNICGFSILSPQDIQLVDNEEGIYRIKSDIDYNMYYGDAISTDGDVEPLDLPEIIKLQSAVINDKNSYYEVMYSDIENPYTINKVPCVDGTVYYNSNSYSFKSMFGDLYTNFAQSEDQTVIGSVLMNNKLLCVSNIVDGNKIISNQIQGFSANIFDCPALDVPDYWIQDNQLNIGSTITIDNSDYIISDKNTLIQLTNTEIYGINTNVMYDGKPHFFTLVYPQGSTAYYKQSDLPDEEWTLMPSDTSTITTYKEAQNYKFDYKVVVPVTGSDTDKREFYGNVELNILPANQYGYLVNTYNVFYDALPHTVYIYTDAEVQFSLNNSDWSDTAPVFTEVGNYTIYYRLIKNNCITVYDSVVLSINAITDEDSINDGIDTSKNIIVMRSQLYSKVSSNTFIYANTNRVYLSNSEPISINVSNFNGEFPDPTSVTSITTELGRFTVAANNYFMVIESYCPWYYHGVIPTTEQMTAIDTMLLNSPLTYTIEYTNAENPMDDDWLPLGSNLEPTNGFYQYKITNINLDENNYVGYLWDNTYSSTKMSTKRLAISLPLDATTTGTNIKTIRILCTHTGNVIYNSATAKPFKKYPNINTLGISLIPLTEYKTPNTLTITTINSFPTIGMKFKSNLTQDAYFSFNCGNNLCCSGAGYLQYDSSVDEFDASAIVKFRNADSVDSSVTLSNLWNTNNTFKLVNGYFARIQFNSTQFDAEDKSLNNVSNTNTDKIFGYLPCNT